MSVIVVGGGDRGPWRRKRQQPMKHIGISQVAKVVGMQVGMKEVG
jgi:hypothetical protein